MGNHFWNIGGIVFREELPVIKQLLLDMKQASEIYETLPVMSTLTLPFPAGMSAAYLRNVSCNTLSYDIFTNVHFLSVKSVSVTPDGKIYFSVLEWKTDMTTTGFSIQAEEYLLFLNNMEESVRLRFNLTA